MTAYSLDRDAFYAGTRQSSLSPTEFSTEIEDYLQSSAKVALEILKPNVFGYNQNSRRIGKVHIKRFHIGPLYQGVYIPPVMPTVVHHHHYPNQYAEDRRKKDEPGTTLRFLVGLISAALGGFAIFKFGQALHEIGKTKEEIKENKEFQKRIHSFRYINFGSQQPDTSRRIEALQKICLIKSSLFNRIKNNAIYNIVLLVMTIASAIIGVTAAFTASYALIGAALVGGLVTGGLFLFKLGYGWNDKKNAQEANQIIQYIEAIKGKPYIEQIEYAVGQGSGR
jgi:hypothetical protein